MGQARSERVVPALSPTPIQKPTGIRQTAKWLVAVGGPANEWGPAHPEPHPGPRADAWIASVRPGPGARLVERSTAGTPDLDETARCRRCRCSSPSRPCTPEAAGGGPQTSGHRAWRTDAGDVDPVKLFAWPGRRRPGG